MGRTIVPMIVLQIETGSGCRPLPRPSVTMSLRLVIPWRVALQQSSPPLHQPKAILQESRNFGKDQIIKPKCADCDLSHPRGSPHCRWWDLGIRAGGFSREDLNHLLTAVGR